MKALRSAHCANIAGAARSYGVIAFNLLALKPERRKKRIACMTNPPGADLHWPEGCMAGIAMHDKSAWSGFALARRVHGRDCHA